MEEINIRRFLVDNKICAAGGEARFLILNNGVKINDKTINDTEYMISDKDVIDGYINIKKGKRRVYKIFVGDEKYAI